MKHFFILLCIVFASLPMKAQQFNGGIMAGLVSSQVAGDTYAGFNKAGFAVGFFVGLDLNKSTTIGMELHFIQKGSRYNDTTFQEDQLQYLLRLNYVDLPLLYQYRTNRFLFEAGISTSFLLSSYEAMDFYESTYDNWRRICFNSVFGVKFQITPALLVGVRTSNSINSIRKNVVVGNVYRYNRNSYGEFNDVLQLSLYYQFNSLGEK
ncbi:MAG: PorT family protein [Bacteroidales bacterium]|nr:PorT family protein [Bacteroidales bacterium]